MPLFFLAEAAEAASGWTPAAVSTLIASLVSGIIAILTLMHSHKNSANIEANAKKSDANQNEHKKQLEVVKHEFNGRVTEAIRVAKEAAEAEVRSAFARGVLMEKESDGSPPVDPEIMADAQRRNVLPGNGPPIANSDITEQNFGKP